MYCYILIIIRYFIRFKERDIAQSLIDEGVMSTYTCTDFSNDKILHSYRVITKIKKSEIKIIALKTYFFKNRNKI